MVTQVSAGVKRILRMETDRDACDPEDKFVLKDISHITDATVSKMYATRLTAEQRESVNALFKTFLGTKKYHNYTKDIKASEMAAMRFMMELTADRFMYVNQHTCDVTTAEDPQAIEFVHFELKGQSFLYNQIRKMIGCMIQVSHGQLGTQFVANTHKDNVMNVALAPGQGLLLEEVSYEKYNRLP